MARRIAVFAPYYPPAYLGGGPARSLHTIVSTAPVEYATSVVTRDRDLGAPDVLPTAHNVWIPAGGSEVRYATATSARLVLATLWELRSRRPEVIYLNSFFDPMLSILPQLLARVGWWRGARRAVAVRGEFRTAALAINAPQKRIYLALYRLLGLHRGVIWHATSEDEAADIRRVMGAGVTIVVRSDGGSPAVLDPAGFVASEGPVRFAFLGRIVPIKGILDALTSLRHARSEIEFDLYGPEEDADYAQACRDAAAALPANVRVRFCGLVEPDLVSGLLGSYDAFLMPTHSENFGHVIGEALASGLPVLVRDVTPWTPYIVGGGGILVGDADGWAVAVDAIAAKPPETRLAMRSAAVETYRKWQANLPTGHLFDDFVRAASQT